MRKGKMVFKYLFGVTCTCLTVASLILTGCSSETSSPVNIPLIANAGENQESNVLVDDLVILDASGSSGPDGDALSYSWGSVGLDLIGISEADAQQSEVRSANSSGTGGIPAVLAKLDQIRTAIENNQNQIEALQADVRKLDSNVVPCTLERFINDECGDYNQPFDLNITLCGNTAANASAAADFQINNSNEFHLGVGFAEVLDVALVRNVEFPGIPGIALAGLNPGLAVYGIPFPNLQAGVDASAGIGLEGCINIPIPIKDIPREEIISLMQQWQLQGASLQQNMMAAYRRLDLVPSRVNSALDSLEIVQSRSLSESLDSGLNDPIKLFSRGTSHGNLIEVLPIGGKIQEVLDAPELLVESLSQDLPRANLANAIQTCADFDGPDAPELLRNVTKNMCQPLKELPDFERINRALKKIDNLPTAQRVKDLICDNVTLKVLFSDCN